MKKNIALKIGAIFTFLLLIIGGGSLTTSGLINNNWKFFGLGIFVLLLGLYSTAVLVQYIGHYDKIPDFSNLTFKDSLKGALMFTFFASMLIFFALSIYFWTQRGLWQIGIIGILGLVFMIFFAFELSIRYQTRSIKKVLADPGATEFTGVINNIDPHFRIEFFGHVKVFFYSYRININNIYTTSFIRSNNPLLKQLKKNDSVRVKLNPDSPAFCAILYKVI